MARSLLIVNSLAKPLFASQVFLGRLNRDMTQEKLNLFQLAASTVTEAGARSSEIMRRKLGDSQSVRVLLHYVPDDLFSYFRPQAAPFRQTQRNNMPCRMAAAISQSSIVRFTQSGIGNVRTCPAFPTRSTMAQ